MPAVSASTRWQQQNDDPNAHRNIQYEDSSVKPFADFIALSTAGMTSSHLLIHKESKNHQKNNDRIGRWHYRSMSLGVFCYYGAIWSSRAIHDYHKMKQNVPEVWCAKRAKRGQSIRVTKKTRWKEKSQKTYRTLLVLTG